MISFVVWKWDEPSMPRSFRPEHVNTLARMIERHYRRPHRLICITDDPKGLDSAIDARPLPVTFPGLMSPHGPRFPSCYRRLWNFSAEAAEVLGERFLALDIDVIIVRDLAPIVDRDESFVGWTDPAFRWNKVAGGVYLLRAGAHREVWTDFDPLRSPQIAYRAGFNGSDQGWMSYKLFPPPGSWTRADGLYSVRWIRDRAPLPAECRLISTPGEHKPWSKELRRRHPWIEEHYR